jgi:hypothetical protein
LRINLISNIAPETLRNQEVPSDTISWVYTSQPVDADVYVVYGVVSQIRFKNTSSPRIFVAVEPPEIFQYDLTVLRGYDYVLAPSFGYLRSLSNLQVSTGLLLWSISRSRQALVDVNSSECAPLRFDPPSPKKTLTTVVSLKRITAIQRRRIEFTRYLKKQLPELTVYGRELHPIDDKVVAFESSSFHIAIENSFHPGYWTEKLSDPILSGIKTLYVGDPLVSFEFRCRGIVPISIDDFRDAVASIKNVLNQGVSPQDLKSISVARRYILEEANLFSRIVQVLAILNPQKSLMRSETINEHALSAKTKSRFWRSEIAAQFLALKYRRDLV